MHLAPLVGSTHGVATILGEGNVPLPMGRPTHSKNDDGELGYVADTQWIGTQRQGGPPDTGGTAYAPKNTAAMDGRETKPIPPGSRQGDLPPKGGYTPRGIRI